MWVFFFCRWENVFWVLTKVRCFVSTVDFLGHCFWTINGSLHCCKWPTHPAYCVFKEKQYEYLTEKFTINWCNLIMLENFSTCNCCLWNQVEASPAICSKTWPTLVSTAMLNSLVFFPLLSSNVTYIYSRVTHSSFAGYVRIDDINALTSIIIRNSILCLM